MKIGAPTYVDRDSMYISRTSKTKPEDYRAIVFAVKKIILEVRSKLKVFDFGAFYLNNEAYGNADWYQNAAMLRNGQVDVNNLVGLLVSEPYQKQHPHRDLFIIDQDATVSGCNFVFGGNSGAFSVLSTARFQGLRGEIRQKTLALLAAHELGHGFGLANRKNNYRNILGGHCNGDKGPCLMEQVNVSGCRDASEQARLIFDRSNWLCPDCAAEAAENKEKSKTTF